MTNPNRPPHDPRTDHAETDLCESEPRHDDHAASNLGYLPASAQSYDRLTLEQWIDLCA